MTFNADDFMNMTVDAPMSTEYLLVPEGEYMAIISTDEKAVQMNSGQGKKDPTRSWYQVELRWEIQDENLKAQLKRDRVTCRQRFFLDIDETTGGLVTEEGRNVPLGQVRAAVNLNSGPFSLSMLKGAGPCMVKVTHTSDDKNPERKYAEITRVAPLK